MAVMGFKVAELVIGVGAVIMLVGATSLMLLAPVLYWARRPAGERAEAPDRQRRITAVAAPSVAH